MKNIVVTGAAGFIGKNLIAKLAERPDISIKEFQRGDPVESLEEYTVHGDFFFHLAGVNRPDDEREFASGNTDFTAQILDLLRKHQKKIPLVLASSIQAISDRPYGRSKKAAEELVIAWAKETGGIPYVYRLSNVFGKWSKPNYNSVVATFCHNIANQLPIVIDDPGKALTLLYIDDLVDAFIKTMDGKIPFAGYEFCQLPQVYKISLQQLADLLYSFNECQKSGFLPDLANPLHRDLYTTYISYLPENGFACAREIKADQRGWLSEIFKSPHTGQIFISVTKPGITRGNHYHHRKAEKFVVIHGRALIQLRKIGSSQMLAYPVSGDAIQIVEIPPGYAHNITNTGEDDLVTVFWASEIFDQVNPDTCHLEV